MIKWLLTGIVIASVLACSGALWADNWALVGTPGFTAASPSSSMQDYDRIKFNCIAFDSAGRIYATVCNGNNNGVSGGLTIFQPNGTKIVDVDVNALGFPGAITKLVTGGDGVVYGLQNYSEIGWGANATNVNRILAFSPTGGVTKIWDASAGPVPSANWIMGMTVGGDGNIFWTMNGNSPYWKTHFLWYYDVAAGTSHEALSAGTNLGALDSSRAFNLEYVGTSADSYDFAVVKSGASGWRVDKVSYTKPAFDGRVYGIDETPGNCDWITALVHDPVSDILWAGSRGGSGTALWANNNGCQLVKTVLDPVSGNRGLQAQASAAGGFYRLNLTESYKVSMGARFRVDSSSADYNRGCVELVAQGNPSPQVILHRNPATNQFAIQISNSEFDIAPFDNNWHTVHIAIDTTDVSGADKKVRVWWDGVPKFDGYGSGLNRATGGWAVFGPSVRDSYYTGSATVTFDWVGVNKTDAINPGGAWTPTLGHFLDCGQFPDRVATTSVMSFFPGAPGAGFFPVGFMWAWHVNGNNPAVSQISNGGRYWVQSIATNPANGEAWMTWNGEDTYNYDPLGTVWTRKALSSGVVSDAGYEGVPEAGAQTVALAFHGGKVYATTCNMTTGVYHVYSKTPGPISASVGQAKQSYKGSLVSTNVAKVVTFPDPEYAFAYNSFYIEDSDRSTAIKVIPDPGQPVAVVGEKALVEGRTGVQNGEAVIYASSVIISSAGSETIAPLAMNVRSVGGTKLGIQPLVLNGGSASYGWPATLNTTGLLVRVAGILRVVLDQGFVDDGSPFPIRLELGIYMPLPGVDGDKITVTGISGVAWDGAQGFRVISPRNPLDMTIQ